MIPVTLDDEDFILFPYPPNYKNRGPRMDLVIEGSTFKTKKGENERWSFSNSFYVSRYTYEAVLYRKQPGEYRRALPSVRNKRILVPIWQVAEVYPLSPQGFKAQQYYITYRLNGQNKPDLSLGYSIHAAAAAPDNGLGAGDMTAPLIACVMDKATDPQLVTDELQVMAVTFSESNTGEKGLGIKAATQTILEEGPELDDASTPYIFPLEHNFKNPAKSGKQELNLTETSIGSTTRMKYVRDHGAEAAFPIQLVTTFASNNKAAELINFFHQHRGSSKCFWVPSYIAETRVTENALQGSITIQVEDALDLSEHQWIAIRTHQKFIYHKIQSLGGNTVTLTEPLAGDVLKNNSSVSSLLLSTFSKRVISLAWITDGVGSCQVDMSEQASEYVIPSGKTRGEDIGHVGNVSVIYEFFSKDRDWQYTAFDQDIPSLESKPWTNIQINHGDITREINLKKSCTINALLHECEPLAALAFTEIDELKVRIARIDTDTNTVIRELFTGDVETPEIIGDSLKAKCEFMKRARNQKIQKTWYQKPCSHKFCSAGCGLDVADWTFTGTVSEVSTSYPYNFKVTGMVRDNSQALPTPESLNFKTGIAWSGDGFGLRTQKITAHSGISTFNLGSSEHTFYVEENMVPELQVGDTVKFRPDCEGTPTRCKQYGNFDQFLGIKTAPRNPSVTPLAKATPNYTKK